MGMLAQGKRGKLKKKKGGGKVRINGVGTRTLREETKQKGKSGEGGGRGGKKYKKNHPP